MIALWFSSCVSWQVSSAAPVAAALASGTASEATLSYLYGGSAAEGVSELSMAIPVYEAIGRVRACTTHHICCFCDLFVWLCLDMQLCFATQHILVVASTSCLE